MIYQDTAEMGAYLLISLTLILYLATWQRGREKEQGFTRLTSLPDWRKRMIPIGLHSQQFRSAGVKYIPEPKVMVWLKITDYRLFNQPNQEYMPCLCPLNE